MNALISDCGKYRYWLTRGEPGRRLCFVMLNPSTADAERDDPTIRRCLGYMRAWGYTELLVLNLYAYRATKPDDLKSAENIIGSENISWWKKLLPAADMVVCAWGGKNPWKQQAQNFVETARAMKIKLYCLGVTRDGHPVHPLYQRADLRPSIWVDYFTREIEHEILHGNSSIKPKGILP